MVILADARRALVFSSISSNEYAAKKHVHQVLYNITIKLYKSQNDDTSHALVRRLLKQLSF